MENILDFLVSIAWYWYLAIYVLGVSALTIIDAVKYSAKREGTDLTLVWFWPVIGLLMVILSVPWLITTASEALGIFIKEKYFK